MVDDLVVVLVSMAGVLGGGLFAFVAQKNIQEKSWRRKIEEEIYAPILDQLYDVGDHLTNLTIELSYPEWQGLREHHKLHWIRPELEKKLWSYFEVDLVNFDKYLATAINLTREALAKEISRKIKKEERAKIQKTVLYTNPLFWQDLSKLVIKKVNDGRSISTITYTLTKVQYDVLEGSFKTRTSFDDFLAESVSNAKNHPFFKEGDFGKELKSMLGKNQELKLEIKKEMGIKQEDGEVHRGEILSALYSVCGKIGKCKRLRGA